MSERGVFAVDRGIWDHDLLADSEPFSRREAWLWILSEAAWKPHRRRLAGRPIDVERGQLAASLRFIASKWRWSEPRVRRFLAALISEQMIDAKTDAGVSVITICKYDDYQRVSLPNDATREMEDDAAATQQRRKVEDREYKEYPSLRSGEPAPAKVKRAKARTALPPDWQPTEADLQYAITGEFAAQEVPQLARAFANYHSAKGSLMADWSAAWRTWIENEIKFRGKNGNRTGNPRTTGHDAILAVATRKARELNRNDAMAGTTGEAGFAFGDGFDRAGSDGHRWSAEGNPGDHQRFEPDSQRIREGEIIAPDKDAAGLPGRW